MPKFCPLKEIISWKKEYTEKGLKSHNKGKLEEFCKRHNLPYKIKKAELVENILLVQNGKKPKHLDRFRTWNEVSNQSEKLDYLRARFAHEYVLATRHYTDQQWATRYHVAKATIALWKNDKNVRKLMEKVSIDWQETFRKSAEEGANKVMSDLKAMTVDRNVPAEIRLKAMDDYLDYAQKNKSNVKGINIVQQTGIKIEEKKEMTEEEKKNDKKEIKELIDLFKDGESEGNEAERRQEKVESSTV